MIVVIKIGSQAIISKDKTLDTAMIATIIKQIVAIKNKGFDVILVSSGAVAAGKGTLKNKYFKKDPDPTTEKQVLASLGQAELIHTYGQELSRYNILASQVLLTKQDFKSRRHYLNIANLLTGILKKKTILPIVNENDSVAISELIFTDNDELAGLIAAQLNAEKLIILTSVDGVYDGSPNDKTSKLIKTIDPSKGWPKASNIKTSAGRGGMISKLEVTRKMAKAGITSHIANAKTDNIINKIITGEEVGTVVLPEKKVSNIKRWLSTGHSETRGIIFVNDCLFNILNSNKTAISLLPVGIEKCDGVFEKGDLVNIHSLSGKKLGVGIAKYGSDKLASCLGQKNCPAFIHYNYLHLDL